MADAAPFPLNHFELLFCTMEQRLRDRFNLLAHGLMAIKPSMRPVTANGVRKNRSARQLEHQREPAMFSSRSRHREAGIGLFLPGQVKEPSVMHSVEKARRPSNAAKLSATAADR